MNQSTPTHEPNIDLSTLTKEDLEELDGQTITKEETEEGRIKEKYWECISDPDRIMYMQKGDKLVFHNLGHDGSRREVREVKAVSSDISSETGIHALVSYEDDQPLHMSLIRRWVDDRDLYICGTRTAEYADKWSAKAADTTTTKEPNQQM